MLRLATAVTLFAASQWLLAAPPADAQAAAAGSTTALASKPVSAQPDQVLPPLPPLTSLPPSSAQEVTDSSSASPPRTTRHSKKMARVTPRPGKAAETTVRVVVSPDSHAYLASVSDKLDAVLQGGASSVHVTLDAASVAMAR
ncbi:hypothetical protein [Trinickia sp. EG282A]|uniref:hypothetical protein n=1 Tax=Trinickia sp. EG282A TaxID=3237013 RepID=UPI0034D2068F